MKRINCISDQQFPVLFSWVEHRDESGSLTHKTCHPNLLSPDWWRGGAHEGASVVLPGIFPDEIGETV